MSEVIGVVESLVGSAQIRGVDGTMRTARVGEELREGEVVITGPGAVISIAVPDAPSIVLPGEREMLVNSELALANSDTADDAYRGRRGPGCRGCRP